MNPNRASEPRTGAAQAPVNADPKKNVYTYDCELVIGGKAFTARSGGEMEVVGS